MSGKTAKVIVSINSNSVDKPFSYIIPAFFYDKAKRGSRVIVPFGRSNKPIEGYIIDVVDNIEENIGYELKSIMSFPDKKPMFNYDLIELAYWMKDKYYATLAECLKCIMPSGVSVKADTVYSLTGLIDIDLNEDEQLIVDYMLDRGATTREDLSEAFGIDILRALTALVKKSVVEKNSRAVNKDFEQFKKYASLAENVNSAEKLTPKQKLIYDYLEKNGKTPYIELKKVLELTDAPFKSLEKKSIITFDLVETRRKTVSDVIIPKARTLELTDEQSNAVGIISDMINSRDKKPMLLFGVTGSGKTEVYLKAIERVLLQGKQAIMLVPEISLTPQTVYRFKQRFGDMVSVTHSRLTYAERYDQWKNAAEGKITVMIGPRSALFTPFENLGAIIIDEEHENTFKSETTPKYDARHAAIKRAELTNSIVILGSATPSMDSFYKAETGQYELITMKSRINSSMPSVLTVDMRTELALGNRSIFSTALHEAISENLEKGLQTILFLNRRGHSTFVSCRQCGYVVKCDDCNINYTYHIYNDTCVCHYCGKTLPPPKNCPQCGSKYIKYFGVGTQKVEEETNRIFPNAKTLRMDMDTTSKKHSHERILTEFRSGKADILIGTQMIAKGLDFPKVTLVGIIAADLSLNQGDYRSGETTFQLLTQVAGRSGRADHSGRVIIQSYNPEHYAIQYAKNADYTEFYKHETALRRQMNYPPYYHIFTALFTGESEKNVIFSLNGLCDIIKTNDKENEFEIVGPAPAFVSKIKKRYRWKLTLKGYDEKRLRDFMLKCVSELKNSRPVSDININLTLDPAVNI